MVCPSEICKKTTNESVEVINRMRNLEEAANTAVNRLLHEIEMLSNKTTKPEESVGEMKMMSDRMKNIEESVGGVKTAVDQILQKFAAS